jgi:hypothetical protein
VAHSKSTLDTALGDTAYPFMIPETFYVGLLISSNTKAILAFIVAKYIEKIKNSQDILELVTSYFIPID